MKIEILYKLKSNKAYFDYLHSHSYWYKYLNRDPSSFNEFIKAYKDYNRNIKSFKIRDTIETIDTLLNVVSTFNS